jgi:TetR/AcrR family transcriptional regulator
VFSSSPESTPTTRAARRKARTAAAILDAGEKLFTTRGYNGTTMYDLSETADVAIGSIYAHFGSKDGVYEALIDRALELDKLYCDRGVAAGTNALECLAGLAEEYLRFAREHPAYFRLFRFPPPERPDEQVASRAAKRIAGRIRLETLRMSDLLEQGMAAGLVRKLEPKATAEFIWAAWEGVLACHLGPANLNLSDAEFERVLNRARESLSLAIIAPEHIVALQQGWNEHVGGIQSARPKPAEVGAPIT